MPCFKGLAVSIHTAGGPLPEYSILKQTRLSRITSYIPVPAPKISDDASRLEPSTFAISITLLMPGAQVPYSRPAATPENPFPQPKIVGGLPGTTPERGNYSAVIAPYLPLTSSNNETIAAYIHFDGRAKEEVATLLRRGEETWVNSRWVSVPESEGGGLAEREFLFREVGLERWLNGLDLEGESKEVAARIERRKMRLQAKRKKRGLRVKDDSDDDDLFDLGRRHLRPLERNGVLRYGEDKQTPVETLSGEKDVLSTSSDSEEDIPEPEAAGQIKVSLFRVLASGEVKKGEYSPQFDAHDDDEMQTAQNGASKKCDADVDHTTTFAKPKSLDPKSISTQTVTGIDPPDRPFATFTFFYRGRRQLQKMGVILNTVPAEQKVSTSKRKTKQMDFASLAPLAPKNASGFAGYREALASSPPQKAGTTVGHADDSMDSDDDELRKPSKLTSKHPVAPPEGSDMQDDDLSRDLSPEEAAKRGELADGVKKIQLKRQHSVERFAPNKSPPRKHSTIAPDTSAASITREEPPSLEMGDLSSGIPAPPPTPVGGAKLSSPPPATTAASIDFKAKSENENESSPFKKQRASADIARLEFVPAIYHTPGANVHGGRGAQMGGDTNVEGRSGGHRRAASG